MAELGLERWDDALAHLRESLELYIDVGDRNVIGRSFSGLSDALIFAGRYAEANEVARRGLAYFADEVSPWRVHLLDGLSQGLAWAEGYEPARAALDEALKLASQLADPALTGRVIGIGAIVDFHFYRLREAVDACQARLSGDLVASPWERALQMRILFPALLFLSRMDEVERVAQEIEPLARKLGQSFPIAVCNANRAWLEFGKEPNLQKLGTNLQRALENSGTFSFWIVDIEEQLALLDFYRGDWAGAVAHARIAYDAEMGSSSEGIGAGTLFRVLAYTGDRPGALAVYEQRRSWMPRLDRFNPRGAWAMFGQVVEGLVILGERSEAAALYPLARQLINTGAVMFWPSFRHEQTVAGIAAAAAHEWVAAENHFQTALEQAKRIPFHLEQLEVYRFHAMMLLDRAARGDRDRAQTLLTEAMETYTQIGMPRHVEMIQKLLARAADR